METELNEPFSQVQNVPRQYKTNGHLKMLNYRVDLESFTCERSAIVNPSRRGATRKLTAGAKLVSVKAIKNYRAGQEVAPL